MYLRIVIEIKKSEEVQLKLDSIMEYTVVIRTLGTAGNKYQTLLDSLAKQTIQPSRIVVYIAEGYKLPKESIGREEYIYVPKGMVAQRALSYNEVESEYILFLDDDVYLPANAVEGLYDHLVRNKADVIAADVFPNAERPFLKRLMMAISGRMIARKDDGKWGYKVMRNAGYSYNRNPKPGVYWSQTNAGPCFFCSKENFLKIRFEEERWVDEMKYALGEDQVMYYKAYLLGLKQLTWFHSGIRHLDAGSALYDENKTQRVIYADFYFKVVFWHRFIVLPEKSILFRIWDIVCIAYTLLFTFLISLLKLNFTVFKLKLNAVREGIKFIQSDYYRSIPKIKKII